MAEDLDFTLRFDFRGNALSQVQELNKGVTTLTEALNRSAKAQEDALNGLQSNATQANAALSALKSTVSTIAKMEGISKASELVEGFKNTVTGYAQEFVGFMREVGSEAATFEDIQSGLQFAFGKDKWSGVFEQVKKDAADLTFTLAEVSDLARSMGVMKINPFGGDKEENQLFMARTGEKIRALSVLQDTADAAGKSTQDLTIAIRNAMGGQWLSLATRFDIPKTKINEWKKSIDNLKEPQEKYNKLVSELAMMFGGAGSLKADNFNKVYAQIPDLIQQIKGGAGAEGLKLITASLKELVASLTDFVKSKDAMKALSDGFKLFAEGVAFGIRTLSALVTATRDFLALAPWFPKVAVAVLGISVAGALASAAILGVATSIAAVGAAIMAVGWEVVLITLPVAALALAATFGVVAGAVMAAYTAFEIFNEGGDDTIAWTDKARALIDALREAVTNWDGEFTYISESAKDSLEKTGMVGWFSEVVAGMRRVQVFWQGLVLGLRIGWQEYGEPMKASMRELFDSVTILGRAFGMTFNEANNNLSEGANNGYNFGKAIVTAASGIAKATTSVIKFVTELTTNIADTMDTLATIYEVVSLIVNGFTLLGTVVAGTVMAALGGILDLVRLIGYSLAWLLAKGEGNDANAEGYAKNIGDIMSGKNSYGAKAVNWAEKGVNKDIKDMGDALMTGDDMRAYGERWQSNARIAKDKMADERLSGRAYRENLTALSDQYYTGGIPVEGLSAADKMNLALLKGGSVPGMANMSTNNQSELERMELDRIRRAEMSDVMSTEATKRSKGDKPEEYMGGSWFAQQQALVAFDKGESRRVEDAQVYADAMARAMAQQKATGQDAFGTTPIETPPIQVNLKAQMVMDGEQVSELLMTHMEGKQARGGAGNLTRVR